MVLILKFLRWVGYSIMSTDDAGKCVDWQGKSFAHVFAQSGIFVLSQIEFGPDGLLDAVSGIKARGDLDATTQRCSK